jgi:hypothetical protein
MKRILFLTLMLMIAVCASAQVRWSVPIDQYPNRWTPGPPPPAYNPTAPRYPYPYPYADQSSRSADLQSHRNVEGVNPNHSGPLSESDMDAKPRALVPRPGNSGNPFWNRVD